jgi:SAM-dependent methyltransferase
MSTPLVGRIRDRWRRAYRHRGPLRKLSTKNLTQLCRDNATTAPTLVIHSEDVDYQDAFPNAFTVTKRADVPADLHVDRFYNGLDAIADASYPVIVCTGLLEHLPDPQRLIDECHRILTPGGKLVISASAVFSFHECPDDYFHFTPYSFRMMLARWTRIEMLRGSSQPFETIGILLQRILIQCEMFPPLRAVVGFVARRAHLLDRFVTAQYHTVRTQDPAARIDSMLPSNIQAVVIK